MIKNKIEDIKLELWLILAYIMLNPLVYLLIHILGGGLISNLIGTEIINIEHSVETQAEGIKGEDQNNKNDQEIQNNEHNKTAGSFDRSVENDIAMWHYYSQLNNRELTAIALERCIDNLISYLIGYLDDNDQMDNGYFTHITENQLLNDFLNATQNAKSQEELLENSFHFFSNKLPDEIWAKTNAELKDSQSNFNQFIVKLTVMKKNAYYNNENFLGDNYGLIIAAMKIYNKHLIGPNISMISLQEFFRMEIEIHQQEDKPEDVNTKDKLKEPIRTTTRTKDKLEEITKINNSHTVLADLISPTQLNRLIDGYFIVINDAINNKHSSIDIFNISISFFNAKLPDEIWAKTSDELHDTGNTLWYILDYIDQQYNMAAYLNDSRNKKIYAYMYCSLSAYNVLHLDSFSNGISYFSSILQHRYGIDTVYSGI